jgi:hypothetical protein
MVVSTSFGGVVMDVIISYCCISGNGLSFVYSNQIYQILAYNQSVTLAERIKILTFIKVRLRLVVGSGKI